MTTKIPKRLSRRVRERAHHRCEYCQTSDFALKLNRPLALAARALWVSVKRHPPAE